MKNSIFIAPVLNSVSEEKQSLSHQVCRITPEQFSVALLFSSVLWFALQQLSGVHFVTAGSGFVMRGRLHCQMSHKVNLQ
jgi:hypothetical protein